MEKNYRTTEESKIKAGIKSKEAEDSLIIDVKVHTTVTPGGQFPDCLTLTLRHLPECQILAEDFCMEGEAGNWLDPSMHPFTAAFRQAVLEGNVLTLQFDGFPVKYFFVDHWIVKNQKDHRFNFSSDQISRVITPVADDFADFSEKDGEIFNYHLFSPEEKRNPDGPLPLVLVFHGFGDTHNLLAYRTSLVWAEEAAQQKRPCFVLSPVIAEPDYFNPQGRQKVYEAVLEKINTMIADGRVDASRIYIMGNSFGGMATIEFMERYPKVAAGAIALCSALNYSETAMEGLNRIVHIPLWIAAAENDGTIPSVNSKNMYRALCSLGSTTAHLTIYSDEEMNAAGGSEDSDSTFSYHHVEMAAMEDEAYAKWLFAQQKKNEPISF